MKIKIVRIHKLYMIKIETDWDGIYTSIFCSIWRHEQWQSDKSCFSIERRVVVVVDDDDD